MDITFNQVVPVLRIFDVDKARAFYVDCDDVPERDPQVVVDNSRAACG